MKNFKFRKLIAGFLFFFVLLMGGQRLETQATEGVQDKVIVLRVDGLGCITCEWNIEGKLDALPGVKESDLTSKRITWWNPFSEKEGKAVITYDGTKVTVEQLIETIEQSSDAVYTYSASVLTE
ncbi:hypothetical protein MNBD_NITROSPIRAE01-438 [hydrothermal vent metagenome]|uniref:HMA domain-containing protein n=1 Tax=hydrothermal vent metagenome TaxID=652676 RepID=A0A3B1D5J8_9ZZZZ